MFLFSLFIYIQNVMIVTVSIGSGMSILSMVAYRMITQEGLNRCLKIYDLIEKKLIEGNDKTDNTVDATDTEVKLSKSAKRRLRKKRLKDASISRKDDDIVSSENKSTVSASIDRDTIDVRVYELANHSERRSPHDFLERSLMAAFLLKCLQRVNFFEDTSGDDGNYI